jgi:oxygen-independent coproporphyrinogen-3 oxidase
MDDFVEAIRREIDQTPADWKNEPVQTIYFGGGTPSMLAPAALEGIINQLKSVFHVNDEAEVTLEANPEDISPETCSKWLASGINRLSLGIQTFQENALQWMNRPHSAVMAKQAIATVAAAGFRSFSCDLIYALPDSSKARLKEDIATMLAFSPPHISAYTLTVEEGTRLAGMISKGRMHAADDETAATQMEVVATTLEEAGYTRYEVSNFCKPDHHSRHNSAYWNHSDYFGYGPGAHSFRKMPGNSAVRWENPAHLNRFVKCNDFSTFRILTPVSAASLREEKIYLGLRTKKGLSLEELFPESHGVIPAVLQSLVSRFESLGLVHKNGTCIAVTSRGFALADRIALDFIALLPSETDPPK